MREGSRVSDDELERVCGIAEKIEGLFTRAETGLGNSLALDLRDARAEVEKLREALAFYRDGWSYKTGKTPGLTWRPKEELLDDCGNIARAALTSNSTEYETFRTKLCAVIGKLVVVRKALEPFSVAHEKSSCAISDSDLDNEQPRSVWVTLGDFRRARTALASTKAAQEGTGA